MNQQVYVITQELKNNETAKTEEFNSVHLNFTKGFNFAEDISSARGHEYIYRLYRVNTETQAKELLGESS